MTDNNSSIFSAISPSALVILETRSFTSIPFAKESFDIISEFNQNHERADTSQFSFGLKSEKQLPKEIISRIMHFEARYRSIDKGIKELANQNILEFSSGYSLRGLNICSDQEIQFIDTDLQEIIETKIELLSQIINQYEINIPENLVLRSMNALNEKEFLDTVAGFKYGPITLVNEGLLMYLDREQKIELCNIIHNILSEYGGYWITSDIYVRDEEERKKLNKHYNQSDQEFVKKHNIDANKFGSFKEAEDFFKEFGFKIYKKIEVENDELSSFKLLEENNYTSNDVKNIKKTRKTWILSTI